MSQNEDSVNQGSHPGSDTPTAEELAGWFIRNLADEVTAWQSRLPAIQPFISRYMRTDDFAELTVLACSADSEDDMERAVENSIIIPAFTIIGNSDPSLPVRPSLVAGTFDTRTEAIVQAGILANRMNELYGAPEPEEPEERAPAIGAKVDMVMYHKDSPESPPPGMLQPGYENKVMHTSFRVGESLIMASDGCGEGAKFGGFSLSLSLPTEADAQKAFAALSEGGNVTMPLMKTFWSPCFGMLEDKFGVGWMVTVCAEESK